MFKTESHSQDHGAITNYSMSFHKKLVLRKARGFVDQRSPDPRALEPLASEWTWFKDTAYSTSKSTVVFALYLLFFQKVCKIRISFLFTIQE